MVEYWRDGWIVGWAECSLSQIVNPYRRGHTLCIAPHAFTGYSLSFLVAYGLGYGN